MGKEKFSLISIVKSWVCWLCWPLFLWSIDKTDEEYWKEIAEQEADRKDDHPADYTTTYEGYDYAREHGLISKPKNFNMVAKLYNENLLRKTMTDEEKKVALNYAIKCELQKLKDATTRMMDKAMDEEEGYPGMHGLVRRQAEEINQYYCPTHPDTDTCPDDCYGRYDVSTFVLVKPKPVLEEDPGHMDKLEADND